MKNLHIKYLEIKRERPHIKPCENSLFSALSLFVKNFVEEIQQFEDHVNTSGG